MFYKSKSIESLGTEYVINDLCYYNGYYYFEMDGDVDWAETASDEEFRAALASVVHSEPEQPEPTPSQLDNIEQTQLVMMEAMADQYEESQERDLTSMEVQATIYEEILALKGEV